MKLNNGHKQVYIINKTLQADLDFIRHALQDDLEIVFEVPIAFIIPKTLMASSCLKIVPSMSVVDTLPPCKFGGT